MFTHLVNNGSLIVAAFQVAFQVSLCQGFARNNAIATSRMTGSYIPLTIPQSSAFRTMWWK